MSPSLHHRRLVAAIFAATFIALPVQAHEANMPHLIHVYEGHVALGVVVLSLVGAGRLIRRALRR